VGSGAPKYGRFGVKLESGFGVIKIKKNVQFLAKILAPEPCKSLTNLRRWNLSRLKALKSGGLRERENLQVGSPPQSNRNQSVNIEIACRKDGENREGEEL